MRARTVLATLAAVAATALCTAPPAQAAGAVQITLSITCVGCGVAFTGVDVACPGPCAIGGAACAGGCHYAGSGYADVPPGICPLVGDVVGDVRFLVNDNFTLTWRGTDWVAQFATGETASGSVVPAGVACGGPAVLTFAGVVVP